MEFWSRNVLCIYSMQPWPSHAQWCVCNEAQKLGWLGRGSTSAQLLWPSGERMHQQTDVFINPRCMLEGHISHSLCVCVCVYYHASCFILGLCIENKVPLGFYDILKMCIVWILVCLKVLSTFADHFYLLCFLTSSRWTKETVIILVHALRSHALSHASYALRLMHCLYRYFVCVSAKWCWELIGFLVLLWFMLIDIISYLLVHRSVIF